MATPRIPKSQFVQHADDKDKRRKERICKAFMLGQSAAEIAKVEKMTKERVAGIISRAGLSRGDKPSPPKRFSWEKDLPARL